MLDGMVAALARVSDTMKSLLARQPQGRHFAVRQETAVAAASRRTIGSVALTMVMLVGLVALAGPARPSFGDELVCLPIHKVQPGETLSKIARRYDVPVEVIVAVNGTRWSINDQASWDHLLAGEVIFVTKRDCSDRTWGGHTWSEYQEQKAQSPVASGVSQDVLDFAEANYEAGFRGEKLVIMTAINGGESRYDKQPCNGSNCDANLVNAKWGPSVTGYQIRTLKHPDRYPDGWYRDRAWLESDPMRNGAIATWHISGGGSNFDPWGAYTDGNYRAFLPRARAAANAVTAAREG